MEWWQAVVLGVVEGITEYLPISSTGHLIIASDLMGLTTPEKKAAVDAFMIAIQGGAILAVAGLYWPRLVRMFRGVFGKDADGLKLLINIVIAFMPAAVVGVLMKGWIDAHLMATGPVALALALGGVYMIGVDQWRLGRFGLPAFHGQGKEIEQLSPLHALTIGLLQCVAMWPGVSRSMMTITGGLLVGLKPKAAAEFSFLLGLPTLAAASLYALGKNIHANLARNEPSMFEVLGVTNILIGVAVATVSAALAVKWLVGFLNRHGLTPFGYYRIALAAVLVVLSLAGLVKVA
jgi:undecaprenyl-diphosphatase